MSDDLLYAVAIASVHGVGSTTVRNLYAHFGSCKLIFHAKKKELIQVSGVGEVMADLLVQQRSLSMAEEELRRMEKFSIEAVTYHDPRYPERLKHCSDAPFLLYYRGEFPASEKILSVVGTRNATEEGVQFTTQLIKDLSEQYPELIVVSGLAYGIDIAAHKAALHNGLKTIAVLGHGLDRVYPSTHRNTAYEIVKQGGLLADFSTQAKVGPKNFISRNRIIAGLSDATLVVESASSGGALITADIANSYDREVFAVPGKPSDRWSSGCNKLIKKHQAILLESASDLIEAMNWDQAPVSCVPKQQVIAFDYTGEDKLIVDCLSQHRELPVDMLARETTIPVARLSVLLLNLEFSGAVRSLPGKIYQLVS